MLQLATRLASANSDFQGWCYENEFTFCFGDNIYTLWGQKSLELICIISIVFPWNNLKNFYSSISKAIHHIFNGLWAYLYNRNNLQKHVKVSFKHARPSKPGQCGAKQIPKGFSNPDFVRLELSLATGQALGISPCKSFSASSGKLLLETAKDILLLTCRLSEWITKSIRTSGLLTLRK